jgi:hypothetical protein
MTPDTIEGIKVGVSAVCALLFSGAIWYVVWQFLTACENIAAIKNKVVNNRGEYE